MHTRNRPQPSIRRAQQLATDRPVAWSSTAKRPRRRRPGRGRLVVASLVWPGGCVAAALLVPGVAEAGTSLAAAGSLDEVIRNLRNVIMGLLVGLATLFATKNSSPGCLAIGCGCRTASWTSSSRTGSPSSPNAPAPSPN